MLRVYAILSRNLSIRLDLPLSHTLKVTGEEICRLKKHIIVTSVHVNVPQPRHVKLRWFSLSVHINVVVVPHCSTKHVPYFTNSVLLPRGRLVVSRLVVSCQQRGYISTPTKHCVVISTS